MLCLVVRNGSGGVPVRERPLGAAKELSVRFPCVVSIFHSDSDKTMEVSETLHTVPLNLDCLCQCIYVLVRFYWSGETVAKRQTLQATMTQRNFCLTLWEAGFFEAAGPSIFISCIAGFRIRKLVGCLWRATPKRLEIQTQSPPPDC